MRNPWLCISIVIILGLGGIIGLSGLIGLANAGKPTSEALIAIVAGCFGNLASFLVMVPKGSVGVGEGHHRGEGP